MTEQAKMQPFYVLVNNETGTMYDSCYERSLQFCLISKWRAAIDAGTHRIEHMRDQSAFVEELLELAASWTRKVKSEDISSDSKSLGKDIAFNDASDELKAILSKYGEK